MLRRQNFRLLAGGELLSGMVIVVTRHSHYGAVMNAYDVMLRRSDDALKYARPRATGHSRLLNQPEDV